MPEQHRPSTLRESPSPVRWRSWPLGEHPVRGLLLLPALGAVFLAIQHHAAKSMAALAVAALAVALWRFFLPVVFEMNVDGIHVRALGRHRRISWLSVEAYRVFSDGVLLLPFTNACPADALRGLYLPWADRREEVLANLRFYLDRREWGGSP